MRYIVIVAALVAMVACKSGESTSATAVALDPHAGHAHAKVEAEASKEQGGNEIIFTPEQAKAAGVEIEVATPKPFSTVIKTSGTITAPADGQAVIVAPTSGIVTFGRGSIAPGASVGQGEVVAVVTSNAIADGDVTVRLRGEYNAAKRDYDRSIKLAADKIVSERELEPIRQRYESAKAAYDALTPAASGTGIGARAPIGGYIKSIDALQGAYVNVGDPIATVTRNRRVQLRAEVSQRHYAQLRNIASANFVMPYNDKLYRLSDLGGRLVSVGQGSSDDSFYVPVTFEFDNKGDIAQGAFVEVYLISAPKGSVISLPVAALTEEQGLYFVYVKIDAEGYMKREVTIGNSDGQRVEILRGIAPQESVVTVGTTQIKLAANSGAIPEGHSHNH